EVNGDDGADHAAGLVVHHLAAGLAEGAVGVQIFGELDGIHVVGARVDVDELRPRAGLRDCLRGRDESVRHGEHGVPCADAGGQEREAQRVGTAARADTEFRAAEESELALKGFHGRASDEAGSGKRVAEDFDQFSFEFFVRRDQVQERNWLCVSGHAIFLFFLVPLPSSLMDRLVTGLQYASAEITSLLFTIAGVPVLRHDQAFALANLEIEIARECSGIRSAMGLIMLSAVFSRLFLRSNWSRAALLLLTIPLAIIKNGLRIFTLSTLAAYVDPAYL